MAKWNHEFELNFTIRSEKEDASDVTLQMVIEELEYRLSLVKSKEFECNHYDTWTEEMEE